MGRLCQWCRFDQWGLWSPCDLCVQWGPCVPWGQFDQLNLLNLYDPWGPCVPWCPYCLSVPLDHLIHLHLEDQPVQFDQCFPHIHH